MISCLRQRGLFEPVGPLRPGRADSLGCLPDSGPAYFFSTGRAALAQVAAALGLGEGDAVLLPAYVAEGAISPFRARGVGVRFYRTDGRLLVDPVEIDAAVAADKSLRLLLVIHPMGWPQPIEELAGICRERDLVLVEDCAQGLLSRSQDGRLLGSLGQAALFSFNKFLPVSDGAAVVANDQDLAARLARLAVRRGSLKARGYYRGHLLAEAWFRRCQPGPLRAVLECDVAEPVP